MRFNGEQDVGGDFLHDFVREAVNERAGRAQKLEMAGGADARAGVRSFC